MFLDTKLIESNGMSTHLGLSYAEKVGNRVYEKSTDFNAKKR